MRLVDSAAGAAAGRHSGGPAVTAAMDEMAFLAPVHVASAYLVFVAIDTDGEPREVPPLAPETPEEVRRMREAEIRRSHRLARKEEILAARRT
jgi:acyl-CoA hydrolase